MADFLVCNSTLRRIWYQGEISFSEIKRQLVWLSALCSLLLHYKKCARRWLLGDPYLSPLELRVTFTLMVRGAAAVKPRMCRRPPRRDLLIISPPALIETSFRTQQHIARWRRRLTPSVLSRSALTFTRPRRNLWLPKAHHTRTHSGFLPPPFSLPHVVVQRTAPVCSNLTFRLFNHTGGDFTCGVPFCFVDCL